MQKYNAQSNEQPLKPSEFAENVLLSGILNNTYPAGSALPSERRFAEEIGVTRPTLRETLQRLSKEGWVTIRHGKSTIVNDFWKQGGMGMLGTMSRFAEFLPGDFIDHLLEVRILLLPNCAKNAAQRNADVLIAYLDKAKDTDTFDAEQFALYDWNLQLLFAQYSGNLIMPLLFNDFTIIYHKLAGLYFTFEKARASSVLYYSELRQALIHKQDNIDKIVENIMKQSRDIFQQIHTSGS